MTPPLVHVLVTSATHSAASAGTGTRARRARPMSSSSTSRVNSLLEEALWELANESPKAADQTDALDSMIDAARLNISGGMMPEEAEFLFSVTGGPLSSARYESIAARAAQLRQIHAQVAPPPAPIPSESPSSIVDVQRSDSQSQSAVLTDADGEEWEDWPSDPPAGPAHAQPPTPAERAAAAAQRLAQERELRMQRSGGTLRNRAAEIEAEKAAQTVLANLPSRPTLDDGAAARW